MRQFSNCCRLHEPRRGLTEVGRGVKNVGCVSPVVNLREIKIMVTPSFKRALWLALGGIQGGSMHDV